MIDPRRILMTADTVGGVWTYAIELARALKSANVEVILAAMGGRASQAQRSQAATLENVRLHDSEFSLEWMQEPWADVQRAGDWLLDLEAEYRPDLIHLNNYAHGDLPWKAPVLIVGHSCVLSWWEAVHGEAAPSEWNIYARRLRSGLQAANTIIAPSQSMLSSLQAHYGPLGRAQVIPNGRSTQLFRPGPKEQVIFAAGRLWDRAKNIESLIELAPRLPWPVKTAGQAAIASPAGFLTEAEMSRTLSSAAIYALPARYEPFGLSILEAALSGCALVLGDIASLRENWNDAAIFVDPGDPDNIFDGLLAVTQDASLRARLSEAAFQRAINFTPERMAKSYLNEYRLLCQTPLTACA